MNCERINVIGSHSSMESTLTAQARGTDTIAAVENPSSPAKVLILSLSEERELRRVYDRLSDYHVRSGIQNEIADLLVWQKAAKLKLGEKLHENSLVEQNQIEVSYSATQGRIDELRRNLLDFESNPMKTISVNDVSEMFKYLNKKLTKKDFEAMVWEVDEDLNGRVDWIEFKLMFIRNLNDRTGLEPSRLFHLAQFMIYDVNNNGMVSVDETMNTLFNRYGKDKMEIKLKELFGHNMQETGREGGEINFTQFIDSFEKSQLNTFSQTNMGRSVMTSKRKNKQLDALSVSSS